MATAARERCRTVLAVALNHARRLDIDVPNALVELPNGRTRRTVLAPLLDEQWPLANPDPAHRHQ
ncbi:MAG TPA: hypothetical protein VF942_18545, partial [Acidimicrobiales bacterium]